MQPRPKLGRWQTDLKDAGLPKILSNFSPSLGRVDSLGAILRGGAYELKARKDMPARVVIKEYVDIAGAFYGREESGMINAVLDGMARLWRAEEFAGT